MTFEQLQNIIQNSLIPKIQNKNGLKPFLQKKRKFEGWLKVELIDSLYEETNNNILPEENRIDISIAQEWALELKVLTSSFGRLKRRNNSKNIENVRKDLKKLQKDRYSNYKNKGVVFIAFPIPINNRNEWNEIINQKLHNLVLISYAIKFCDNTRGLIYIGRITQNI